MIGELFSGNAFAWACIWQSTACVAAGLVGSFILRRRSARAHQLLLLAMVAAVIVPIMSTLVRHYQLGMFVAEPVVIQPQAEDWATTTDYEASGIISAEDIEHKPAPIEENSASAMAGSRSAKFPWSSVVLWAWVAASLILAARLAVTFVLGVRLLSRALPLGCEKIEEAVHLARARLRIDKDVKVYSSQGIRSPVIWCWKRAPVLLVPSATGRFDNGVDWTGVLCHELAHYKRRDHISGLLAELVVCFLPWHPLLWWAKKRLVKLSEQACDDWVVASGQAGTDYAESLLDLVPQSQMAFAPAVVSSNKGLGSRVRRILKDGCGNPRTGVIWALIVSIAATCLALGVAFAQTRPAETKDRALNDSEADEGRVVHFPKDRSMGTLKVQDSRASENLFYWLDDNWEDLAQARGDVTVPADKRLRLGVSPAAAKDLSPLRKLTPHDLYLVDLPSQADNTCLPYLAHLAGLKTLNLRGTKITNEGLRFIKDLRSLRHLHVGPEIDDAGLVHLSKMKSLKKLDLAATKVTDAGFSHLAELSSLEELSIHGDAVGDAGLSYLGKLTSLRRLNLNNTSVGDAGLAHLKNVTSLRTLSLWNLNITDEGLAQLSNLSGLEELNFSRTQITDDGLAHLKSMASLKELSLDYTQVTDDGLAHLKDIKSLESLRLPDHSLSDKGMAYLAQLPKLKHLNIPTTAQICTEEGLRHLSRLSLLEELDVGGPGVTDEGLSHIAKLTNLKVLWLQNCPITNDGLAKLTTLELLERLTLHNGRTDRNMEITGSGLAHLEVLPSLTYLQLWQLKLDDTRLTHLAGLTQLEQLRLLQTPLCDEDLVSVGKLKHLKHLEFHSEMVTDAGMAYLAGLTSLERLTILGGHGLTDQGLTYLANMKKLDYLLIKGNFTDRALDHLERVRTLAYLRITSGNDFSPTRLETFQKKLPNLGTLRVIKSREVKKRPNIGDTAPTFAVTTLDGKKLKLEDYRDKVVLLYFWATWCTPCVAATPGLKEFYRELSRYDKFEMIGLSLDDSDYTTRTYVRRYELSWPQVRLGRYSKVSVDYGVADRAPTYILIGPDGRILLNREHDRRKIKTAVQKRLVGKRT